ncbi:MAG TPA: hypothetical protein VHZ74_13870 [Bryobacteraceae bacterium]|jgi:hypothetical protein|nr:hypothetical protein [Bryobacteraceae bacterium]
MTAYRFFNPTGLYGLLNGIGAQISVGEWEVASESSRDLSDEAHHQKSAGTAQSWLNFIQQADSLRIAIGAKDEGECVEKLNGLRSALTVIAGPEGNT